MVVMYPYISRRAIACALGVLALTVSACEHKSNPRKGGTEKRASEPAGNTGTESGSSWVDLNGDFQKVVKSVSGRADIVYRDGKYLLYLTGVNVDARPPLRVYLVGDENPRTTRAVKESELIYDMAELDNGADEQVVELPTRPAPGLRSVVIWQQTYAINLAVAPLKPVPQK